jgi:malonate transporter
MYPRFADYRISSFSFARMQSALLLVPDLSLILIGWLLVRYTSFDRQFWSGVEKLAYYVLFPAMLFYATSRAAFDFSSTPAMLGLALLTTGIGVILGYAGRWMFRPDPLDFASGLQTAFRFNGYIALAVAARVGGEQGVALMALIQGCVVPLVNVIAVWQLSRTSSVSVWRELLRNPLILATVLGTAANLLGLQMPEVLAMVLGRLGSASTALGLMAVGAGLQLTGASVPYGIVAWWTAVKLLAMPAFAYFAARYFPLTQLQLQIAVLFASLPTATNAYILAVRLGGNGVLVATVVSIMTLCAVITMPLWLALIM